MKTSALLLAAFELYRAALPGYRYEFPRDHFNHPGFQTEWWYYTGNLRDIHGRRFGFELTFFRDGVDRGKEAATVWDVRDAWLAHLALSDIDGGQFFHNERLNRSGEGLAGASLDLARVWNGNWYTQWDLSRGTQQLQAIDPRFSFNLTLRALKPPVVHGVNGVSQKAAGAGHASHYVSFTRLETRGEMVLEGRPFQVEGLSWMDHEFFTEQLDASQIGWDWFSLQLDDNTELMLFRLRRKDGSADPYSAGTYVDAGGHTTHLAHDAFSVTPGKLWTQYPIEWKVRVPSLGIDVQIGTRLPQQEVASKQNRYWEGAVEINGTRHGSGYVEMTGYVAPVHFRPLRTQEISMSSNNGIITIPSNHSVEHTVQRLQEILAAKNVKLFALIDHSGEAQKAGFQMRPCKLLIFGNPKAGTPLMLSSPLAALDLPLKILIWEKADDTVWLSYNDSAYLQHRHALPENLLANISVVDSLAAKAAE